MTLKAHIEGYGMSTVRRARTGKKCRYRCCAFLLFLHSS